MLFKGVKYYLFEEPHDVPSDFDLHVDKTPNGLACRFFHEKGDVVFELPIVPDSEFCMMGSKSYAIRNKRQTFILKFSTEADLASLNNLLQEVKKTKQLSMFTQRTEDSSAQQYFQFYGYLSQQQNMLQDYVRTSTYQRAVHTNMVDFHGKVVLDVGAGSGILSFFAAQAGASKIYAVEASSIAEKCEELVKHNDLEHVIECIAGKIEEINLPEKVDVIISEPMGYMLYNERMLESYLHAKKFLKPGGKMFPSMGNLYIAPFNDEVLHTEIYTKSSFWQQQTFHGVNLSCLKASAETEYFKQPIVDTFDVRILMGAPSKFPIDFLKASEGDLSTLDFPIVQVATQTGFIHGFAFWFDVAFLGSTETVWLSTSPTEPLTHWYQVRCLLRQPVLIRKGEVLNGGVRAVANEKQSYDLEVWLKQPSTNFVSRNTLDLKNPFFRYTGLAPVVPAGHNTAVSSPTDVYFAQSNNVSSGGNGMVMDPQQVYYMQQLAPAQNKRSNPSTQIPVHPGCISAVGTANEKQVDPVQSSFMIGDYVAQNNVGIHLGSV